MNSFVGEMELELGGKRYLLRPSFDAITNWEDRLDCSSMKLAREVSEAQSIRAKHALAIVYGAIVGGTKPGELPGISFEEFKSLAETISLTDLSTKAIWLMNKALQGRQVHGQEPSSAPSEKKTKSKAKE